MAETKFGPHELYFKDFFWDQASKQNKKLSNI